MTSKSGSEDEDPLYVKHFFIGDKRIASKIGNPPGNDPRGITGVAGKTLHIKVDYPVKYSEQKEQVSANYTNFAMPYSNIDMNNYDYPFNRPGYWNGCVPPNENGTVIVRSADARNGEDANDEEDVSSLRSSSSESSLFFYHTDHLGSTNLVTGSGPTLCHATEYLPYGEEFVDLMASSSDPVLPFKFNGKELDSETGLLYYGARYYMPKYYQWPTCDPLELKYPGVSSYSFCHNNPLNRIDLMGMDDYQLDREGNMSIIKQTKDDFHRVYPTSDTRMAASFFEFAAKNTDVEWSITNVHSRSGYSSILSTSHDYGTEVGMVKLFDDISNDYDPWTHMPNSIIVSNIHSHEYGNFTVSPGDKKFVTKAHSRFPLAQFYIYDKNKYHLYTPKSTSGQIGEVVVFGRRSKQ